MQLWVAEYGTLWAWEVEDGLPPIYPARVPATFQEASATDVDELAVAMNLANPEFIQQRLSNNRRCFYLRAAGQIVSYGWATCGLEKVGELERNFYLHDDEAYIWDCGTVITWRGQGCYSALLSHFIHQLYQEGIPRIWIGASRQNQPSVHGFANAGFKQVVDCIYRRFYRLTLLWIDPATAPQYPLVLDAYRILLNKHERRFGQLAIGFI